MSFNLKNENIILQGYGRTLLHQRRSEAAVPRCFTKYVPLAILQNLQESLFNKVTGLKRPHHKCFSMIFKNTYNKTPYTIKVVYG